MKKPLFVTIIVVILVLLAVWVGRESALAPHITQSPSPSATAGSPSPSATAVTQANIIVTSPHQGDSVTNPIIVTGQARVFENQFNYILRDANGKKLVEGYSMTDAKDAGQYGNFTIKIVVPVSATKDLTVEVFDYSAKDGSVSDLVKVPVVLSTLQTMSVNLYMNSTKIPGTECEVVAPVSRPVIKTNEPAFVALTELLKGPSTSDKNSGYVTTIPSGVKINSLIVRSGVAYADFDETLQAGVGGSCRVAGIRAQITKTLMQFTSIKSVVISINGRTQDILQP